MKRTEEKKIFRKINRFLSKLSNDCNKHIERRNSPSSSICISNAGLANGFTREEIFLLFQSFGEIRNVLMYHGKSFCVVNFMNVSSASECVRQLNGCHVLKEGCHPLYMFFIEAIKDETKEMSEMWPNGLILQENFISEDEENLLLNLESLNSDISCLKNRAVKHFGFEFDYENNQVRRKPMQEKIPQELDNIIESLTKCFDVLKPDQLTMNYYNPGQGIPPHVDSHSSFEDGIVSLSLGSDVIMDFKHPSGEQTSLLLPRRSCLALTGEARFVWSHGITSRKYDATNTPTGMSLLRRGARMSLTFRKVRSSLKCNCSYRASCDSGILDSTSSSLSEEKANDLEQNNVFLVYDTIAAHFSETRNHRWPNVHQFIQSFSEGSILVDVGCGNGKYLHYPNIYTVGCDRSKKLLEICRTNRNEVLNADCRYSPLRDGIADGIICIAVIHHLATENRRLQAIKDISRLLCPGGRALIYVWAKEQQLGSKKSTYLSQNKKERPECNEESFSSNVLPVHENRTNFKHSDLLVPWKTKENNESKTHLRYYHVFQSGELESMCSQVSDTSILRSFYDQGNWCIELKKHC